MNENELIKEGKRDHTTPVSAEDARQFNNRAILLGGVSGLLMSIFLGLSGAFIEADNASFGFAKYLILAAGLGVVLGHVKRNSPPGDTFKHGMVVGIKTTAVAAVTLAIMTAIINSMGDTPTIQPYFQQTAGDGMNTFVWAGIALVETFVAGMILTFIWLQFLKDRSTSAETVA